MSDLVALRTGTILVDDYRIERVLGAGGFGITYLAEEVPLARLVTIKEFFPVDFAARDNMEEVVPRSQECEGDYTWGLDRFLAEAQTLARFDHPNIVRVYRFFQARNTGYIVLHYEEGQSFKGWLRSLGRAPRQVELDSVLAPLLGALETVHAADYLHRDIAPDNIMIRRDGSPVLIDFGSARGDIAKHSKTISALVKSGYSPYEQYASTSRQQGPWTDIYSLGATLYEAVTNRRPPDAPSRMVADELIPPADAALASYRPQFLAAIAKSLRLEIGERPRSVAEWRDDLMAPPPRPAPPPAEPAPAPQAPAAKPRRGSKGGAAMNRTPAMAEAVGTLVEEPADRDDLAGIAPIGDSPQPRTRDGAKARVSDDIRPKSLAGAFLAGWRKANPAPPRTATPSPARSRLPAQAAAPAKSVAAAPALAAPAVAEAAPVEVRKPSRDRRLRSRFDVWPSNNRQTEAPPAEPGARKATPRALRRSRGGRWRSLAAKLVLGVLVAAAAVAIQDKLPVVRHEGAGVMTSHTGADVPLASLKGHRSAVTGLAFTLDGQSLVSTSTDGTLRVWRADTGRLLRTFELDGGAATSLGIAEGRVASGHANGTIAVFDLVTGSKIADLKHSEKAIGALVFAGRPDRLISGAEDGLAAIWDTAQPAGALHTLDGHDGAVRSLAYAARGPFVASGSADGTARLWHVEKAEVVRAYRGHEEAVTAVAFDPKGTVLASADRDGVIRLWSTFSNRLKRRLKGHEGAVTSLAFSSDGNHLASSGADGTLRIWDAANGKTVRTLQAGNGAITAIGISRDGKRIATAFADGSIRVWEANWPKTGT